MKLDELRKLGEAATDGPWSNKSFHLPIIPDDRVLKWTDTDIVEGYIREGNAKFIVAARNHWDALLAVVEAANGLRKYGRECADNADLYYELETVFDGALAKLEAIGGK